MTSRRFLILAASFALAAWTTSAAAADMPATATEKSKAIIEAKSGSSVSGAAVATETKGAVEIVVDVAGASAGVHAVHIHEKGDCSAPDATSAGGHFNPTGEAHGAPDADHHHAGDFGNMTVGADGKGHLVITSKMLTVAAGPNSVAGRAIIVHEKEDDMKTQPTGNAGGRIGCGVFK